MALPGCERRTIGDWEHDLGFQAIFKLPFFIQAKRCCCLHATALSVPPLCRQRRLSLYTPGNQQTTSFFPCYVVPPAAPIGGCRASLAKLEISTVYYSTITPSMRNIPPLPPQRVRNARNTATVGSSVGSNVGFLSNITRTSDGQAARDGGRVRS